MNSKILPYKQLELANALDKAREARVFVVADAKVKNMLPQWLQFAPDVFWLNQPEEQKNLDVFAEATHFFLKQGILRSHTIMGIGGGATTDLAGFIAATIHRGVRWIAVPTTLIGMIDAAIGGKTGVNTSAGKNLIGAFHAPEEVWICSDFLKTLTSHDILSGKGELLKYGLLDEGIYQSIMAPRLSMDELILKCAQYKLGVVERDFTEKGERAYLNLGHTLGHAFEHVLRIPHGVAVTMGMKYLFKAFELKEATSAFEKLFNKLDLDDDKTDISTYKRLEKTAFWSALGHDKKRTTAGINLVLLDGVGAPRLQTTPLPQLKSRLEALSDFKD